MQEHKSLPALPMIVVTFGAVASSIYFSLGVVAEHAKGFTPILLAMVGIIVLLTAFTYVEAVSLHPEPGGTTVFARHAFNELVSFIAGWAILLDYVILIALSTLSTAHYLGNFWKGFGAGWVEFLTACVFITMIGLVNFVGIRPKWFRGAAVVLILCLVVPLILIVFAIVLLAGFESNSFPQMVVAPGAGDFPSWENIVFALSIAAVTLVGFEAGSALVGETVIRRRVLRKVAWIGGVLLIGTYTLLGYLVEHLPRQLDVNAPANMLEAPVLEIAHGVDQSVVGKHLPWLDMLLGSLVSISAPLALTIAAISAMLGLSRLGYSLAVNRQIPSRLGRLHDRYATPYILIGLATALAMILVVTLDFKELVSVFAFGAMLTFTIAHISVCVLRFREPDRPRAYSVPCSIPVGRYSLPLPAVLGGLLSGAIWVGIALSQKGTTLVWSLWMFGGLVLYVIYRRSGGKSILRRVTVPAQALYRASPDSEFSSILVPVFGLPLDDDIMQTAGRLASEQHLNDTPSATIEALWVFRLPLSLPLDAALPAAQLTRAKEALNRARAVGEEYEGVQVATAMTRSRRLGEGILAEAERRGVEVIVLSAEAKSRMHGGTVLGGQASLRQYVLGDVTRYVLQHAHCRVILTAPAE